MLSPRLFSVPLRLCVEAQPSLRNHLRHHLAVDVGEPEVAALEAVGQRRGRCPSVEDGGVQVVDVDRVPARRCSRARRSRRR